MELEEFKDLFAYLGGSRQGHVHMSEGDGGQKYWIPLELELEVHMSCPA